MIRPTLATLLSVALLTVASGATAQPKAAPTTKTTKTADYVEQNLGGDQVVTFGGDDLAGMGPSPYGDVIRPRAGLFRAFLIRPRLNFVPELLKSVENL